MVETMFTTLISKIAISTQLLVCRRIGMMNRLMASKPLHPVITKLKAWRTARGFSQSQTIRALVAGRLPIKLGTLQQWERARSSLRL